jgi:hypothetical protein
LGPNQDLQLIRGFDQGLPGLGLRPRSSPSRLIHDVGVPQALYNLYDHFLQENDIAGRWISKIGGSAESEREDCCRMDYVGSMVSIKFP